MKKNTFRSFLAVLLFPLMQSCNFDPGSTQIVGWEIDMLGPVAKTTLDLQDIVNKAQLSFADTITLIEVGAIIDDDLPFTIEEGSTIPAPLPSISNIALPDYPISIPDAYQEATFESGFIQVTVVNEFPVAILSGTIIKVKLQNGEEVVSHTVTQDIPVGGTYVGEPEDISGKTAQNEMVVAFENFSLGALTSPVVVTQDQILIIQAEVIDPVLESVFIATTDEVKRTDTTAFNLEGEEVPISENHRYF